MGFLKPKVKKPKEVKPAQIDEARVRSDNMEDINRRRGSAANVLGGLTDTPPETAAAKLLGG